jgi:hypothetical protein
MELVTTIIQVQAMKDIFQISRTAVEEDIADTEIVKANSGLVLRLCVLDVT